MREADRLGVSRADPAEAGSHREALPIAEEGRALPAVVARSAAEAAALPTGEEARVPERPGEPQAVRNAEADLAG